LISAPVQLVSSGREQLAVGMERAGRRCSLLRGQGSPDAQPREGELDRDKSGPEAVGGGALGLGGGLLGLVLTAARGGVLAGVGGCGGCCGHVGVDSPWGR
jgi:hypothetical protein